jgi:NAD(P)-dependent dehydrogenase (short-subunit alcohol dehydrogenase family)
MPSSAELKGHVALVTGAGRRLGRAFAEALASHGADVAIHYAGSVQGAEDTLAAVQAAGRRGAMLQADLARPELAAGLLDRAIEALGPIDLLVNNAAIFEPLGVYETSQADWERHLAINLTAPFLLSQGFARHRGGQPGAIVNLLDWRALRPGPDHLAYTIAKAGLAALTRSLAQALAPTIRVNGLALGAILPPPEAGGEMDEPPSGAPIARWATMEETTGALLFLLAGPDFITGEILHLDGGRHLI